jgi:hypothetical protein
VADLLAKAVECFVLRSVCTVHGTYSSQLSQWLLGVSSPGIKQPQPEGNHALPSSAKVKKTGNVHNKRSMEAVSRNHCLPFKA